MVVPVTDPAVLHFNDCANVGANLVRAARAQGWRWGYVPPAKVRPTATPEQLRGVGKARYLPFLARRRQALQRADVVHVHYATSARLLRERFMPRRPYFLHLHGTDIRTQWLDPAYHDEVRRAAGEAVGVFYTTPDNREHAQQARPDAEYMPVFVNFDELPAWQPADRPRVVFVSRWEDVKGLADQLATAQQLADAVGPDVELVGLDWGPGADAARQAGVRLIPPLPHPEYLDLLASAHVTVGQSTAILSVSELEAMAIGVPLAASGEHYPMPDGGTPPIVTGTVAETVEQVVAALADPPATARTLDVARWVRDHHDAADHVTALEARYRAAATSA
ncbi:glycosyltransferase family 4 protein [Georgenia yuyongxinii]|uniref:Glycosyltransferase family 4 protein n=1 Tax=Georgenia yuyongxinii TaxID=2589797 RepID=A0A552WYH8_9MICO|nr:glycosyltransferase family 4 protein [Georgenia yuyongxinii]